MLTTAFRIVFLDLTSPGKPLYGICQVTLNAENRPVAWSPGDIRFRGDSTAELLETFRAVRVSLDSEILVESELNKRGVRYVSR